MPNSADFKSLDAFRLDFAQRDRHTWNHWFDSGPRHNSKHLFSSGLRDRKGERTKRVPNTGSLEPRFMSKR